MTPKSPTRSPAAAPTRLFAAPTVPRKLLLPSQKVTAPCPLFQSLWTNRRLPLFNTCWSPLPMASPTLLPTRLLPALIAPVAGASGRKVVIAPAFTAPTLSQSWLSTTTRVVVPKLTANTSLLLRPMPSPMVEPTRLLVALITPVGVLTAGSMKVKALLPPSKLAVRAYHRFGVPETKRRLAWPTPSPALAPTRLLLAASTPLTPVSSLPQVSAPASMAAPLSLHFGLRTTSAWPVNICTPPIPTLSPAIWPTRLLVEEISPLSPVPLTRSTKVAAPTLPFHCGLSRKRLPLLVESVLPLRPSVSLACVPTKLTRLSSAKPRTPCASSPMLTAPASVARVTELSTSGLNTR